MAIHTYKTFINGDDTRTSNTKVTLQVSGVLPQDSTVKAESQKFPNGYTTPNFTWFTFNTSSQIADINWGFRSASFADTDSMFYQSDSKNPTKDETFTTQGKLSISKTASMVYKTWASQLGSSELSIDGDSIDLLGIINWKRNQYRDRLEPGTLQFSLRTSGSTYTTLTDTGTTNVYSSPAGPYSYIQNVGGGLNSATVNVGKFYYNRAVAVFDLFKTFFPSSTDRVASNRANLMAYITGSGGNTSNCIHQIGFFSGSDINAASEDAKKRSRYKYCNPGDILNFYSGSYSQSLNTLTRDFSGIRANAAINFKTKLYFCRALHNQFNYSDNPTFGTGSVGKKSWRLEEPETFITTVGLFNDSNECLAVGKLSQPLRKDFGRESIIRLRLDF